MSKIALVGSGFIATGIYRLLQQVDDFKVSSILSRRSARELRHLPEELITDSVDALVESSDIAVVATGDVLYATPIVETLLRAEIPVVTIDPELHVTTGPYLSTLGYLTEAEGDQPGCLAALKREAEAMGFEPLAYMNIKGFYYPNPKKGVMEYWAEKNTIRLEQVTAFTDGSKLQLEQAFVANGLGATIAKKGLHGGKVEALEKSDHFARMARTLGSPISDYVICPSAPKGVFILTQSPVADHYRHYPLTSIVTEEGEAFMLVKPYHLCHLEVLKTLREVVAGAPPLLNSPPVPTVGVAAISKRPLKAGDIIERGLGSFDVRGECVLNRTHPNHVPICLLENARISSDLPEGQVLTFEHVELPHSRALEVYLNEIAVNYPESASAKLPIGSIRVQSETKETRP